MWSQTKASLVFSLVLLCFFREALSGGTCNQRCQSKIDIVVVIDENCDPDEYVQLKSFCKAFAQTFEIGPDTVHFGAVGYSLSSRELFPVSDNANSVQQGFNGWTQSNGHYSNVQSGLHRGSDCFKPYPQRQPEFEIVIIITKHNPNKCDSGNDPSSAALQEANSCKSHPNRKIITIVVGNDCDTGFYGRLSSQGGVFNVPSYSSLSSLISKLLDYICYRPPTLWIPPDYHSPCCGDCTKPPQTGQATTYGYCHGCPPHLSYSDKIIEQHSGNTFTRYIRRTWTSRDDCGNSKSDDQLVYLLDLDPPRLNVPSDKTFECCDDIYKYDFGRATATDNCDGNHLNITYEDSFVDEYCPYFLQRVYSVYDSCGNQASGIQSISFTDTKPPIIVSYHDFCITPDDNKKFCIFNLSRSDLIVAHDECSEGVDIEFIEVTSSCGTGKPSRQPSREPSKSKSPAHPPSRTPHPSKIKHSKHPRPSHGHSKDPSSTPTKTVTPTISNVPSSVYASRTPTRSKHARSNYPSRSPAKSYSATPTTSQHHSNDPSTTPTRTPSYTPTSSHTPPHVYTHSASKSPSSSHTPSNPATPSSSYSPSKTPSSSHTPPHVYTHSASKSPSSPHTPSNPSTPSSSYTPSKTPSSSHTPPHTYTHSASITPTHSLTSTQSPSRSVLPPSSTNTVTHTPTHSPSSSAPPVTPSSTNTATHTPTHSPSSSAPPVTPSTTNTATHTPTHSPSSSAPPVTPSSTNTATQTPTPSPSSSVPAATPTRTVTRSPSPSRTPSRSRVVGTTGTTGNAGTGTGNSGGNSGMRFRVRDLKSFGEEDEPLRDVGQDDSGKCVYDPKKDTLCIDAKPCHIGRDCTDRIYYIKFAVSDKCGNRKEQIVTVTVPAYSDDSRCKDCVSPR